MKTIASIAFVAVFAICVIAFDRTECRELVNDTTSGTTITLKEKYGSYLTIDSVTLAVEMYGRLYVVRNKGAAKSFSLEWAITEITKE
jgi:hypothetical protein